MTKTISTVAGALLLTAACSSQPAGGRPTAEYDPQTGRLTTLAYDATKNGKNDTVSYMDGARILRIELDLDENGKTERWDFYTGDRTLEKVGFSRLNDGVMDAQAFYEPVGVLSRMEISTRRDGRFDRVEYYADGALTLAAEDTNGDGRADKWDSYRPEPQAKAGEQSYAITETAFDDSGSGRPERRLVYGPGGGIARVEVDPDGDGSYSPMTRASVGPSPSSGSSRGSE